MPKCQSLSRLLKAMRRRTGAHQPGRPLAAPAAGSVEPLEPRLLLSATGPIGDANMDGLVDDADVQLIRSQWNQSAAGADALTGDLSGDGYVGLDDLNLVLGSPDLLATPVPTQDQAVGFSAALVDDQQTVSQPLFTDFNGAITGNWTPTFTRNLETVDPFGQAVGVDQPRWGEPVASGTVLPWEVAFGTNVLYQNIGFGPGADGQWLSVWYNANDRSVIAFNEDFSQSKTIDWTRDGGLSWLKPADQQANERFVPVTGRLVPGGFWTVYLQREQDKDPSAGRDWVPVGTSIGIAQEITFNNVFDQQRQVLDTPRMQGLIDSTTGEPFSHVRGREWAMSMTPVVDASGQMQAVWWAVTDYMQDPTKEPAKPGGSTWVFKATRDPGANTYTVRQPRLIEQQEDPLGKAEAFEHRHSAIVVLHETGEVDVIVASGDNPDHSFVKRFRINDPVNYETSSLTVQSTGFLGQTGEMSPQLISFQVGSAPDKILAATDGRDEAVIEITVPRAIDEPAIVREAFGVRFSTSDAQTGIALTLVTQIQLAKPWERSGYAVVMGTVSGPVPDDAITIGYSPDGLSWTEIASNPNNRRVIFHNDTLVMASSFGGDGILRAPVPATQAVQPLMIAPGGTQRLHETLTPQQSFADTTVSFLTKESGLWVDNGAPLSVQPPSLGQVIRIDRLDEPLQTLLTRLNLAGGSANFPAGGLAYKVWLMNAPGFAPILWYGPSSPGQGLVTQELRPVANDSWIPAMGWVTQDPTGIGADYQIVGGIRSSFRSDPGRVSLYLAFDLLLNETDLSGGNQIHADIDGDAFVGITDLNIVLGEWGRGMTPPLISGDMDGDGFVGITDLNVVLQSWNNNVTPGDLLQGDADGDGFVGITDLSRVLENWNIGEIPPTEPLRGDLNGDQKVGIEDLNIVLAKWGQRDLRPTLAPGYPIGPSDTVNPTGEPERLSWQLPTPSTEGFVAAVALSIPGDGIDSVWGRDMSQNGSTNYGSIYADANNKIELWHHRGARQWSLEIWVDGLMADAIRINDAWLNPDGRLNWVVSYDPLEGVRLALQQQGNVVVSGVSPVTLSILPTTMQIGSQDWLSVPTVGVKSAYFNPGASETEAEVRLRAMRDPIYLG